MKKTVMQIPDLPQKLYGQVKYATFFIDEAISETEIENAQIIVTHSSQKTDSEIIEKIQTIIDRFSSSEMEFSGEKGFENRVSGLHQGNIMAELLEKKIIKQLEPGVFTYREPFSGLLRFFDHAFTRKFGYALGAVEEYYPVTIHGHTLNKVGHFTSFPEHILFVSHLREDLDVLDDYVKEIRKSGGWSEELDFDHSKGMKPAEHMINPATCYHCYEALQNEELEGEGIVVTAVSKAYRFESKNHSDFGRLMDFTLREVIFVGKPDFVRGKRDAAQEILKKLVAEWELDCWMEDANDPFFTNDYQVKASYQRKQKMKQELRMKVPYLDKDIAVFSSNFHGNVFANAFNIKAGKRAAVTSCIGFGLERWVLAFLAQYGLQEENWPEKLLAEYREFRKI